MSSNANKINISVLYDLFTISIEQLTLLSTEFFATTGDMTTNSEGDTVLSFTFESQDDSIGFQRALRCFKEKRATGYKSDNDDDSENGGIKD